MKVTPYLALDLFQQTVVLFLGGVSLLREDTCDIKGGGDEIFMAVHFRCTVDCEGGRSSKALSFRT